MNSTLLKLAVLGTDSQACDFTIDALAPFAESFVALRDAPPKATLLAAGVDAVFSDVQTPTPDPKLAELAQLKPINRDALIPIDVADELIRALSLYAEAFVSFSDGLQEAKLYPSQLILRPLARCGLKIPPERAAQFLRVVAQFDAKAFEGKLNLGDAVGSVIMRDLIKQETNLARACRLIPVFLEPYDRPQGVTLDALATRCDLGTAINEREDALRALRFLAPQRAREIVANYFKEEKPERRKRLLAAFDVRLELDDAPFLEEIVAKDRSNEVKEFAFDLLAKLRETNYAAEIVKVGDTILGRDGDIKVPEATPALKKLGVLAFVADSKKKRDQAEELVARAFRRIPLEHWETVFQATPDEILAKLESHSDFPLILNGFRSSLLLFGGPLRWETPLIRLRKCDKDHRKTLVWTQFALCCIRPQDVVAARNAVDAVLARAEDAAQRLREALALLLAFYEPHPWRESFANFYDDAISNAFISCDANAYKLLQEKSENFTKPFVVDPELGAQPKRNFSNYVFDLVAPIFPALPKRLQTKFRLISSVVAQEYSYYYAYTFNCPHPLIAEIRPCKAYKRIVDSDDIVASFDRLNEYFASLEQTSE